MSYDLSIRSEQGHGADRREVAHHLVAHGLVSDSPDHFMLLDSGAMYADIDLASHEEGQTIQSEAKIHSIQVHIPYAFYESHRAKVLEVCTKIAASVGWRIYDEQEGKYLE